MLTGLENQENYESNKPPSFSITVTTVLFAIAEQSFKVLLTQRETPPFRDAWEIPSDLVLPYENLEDTARRILKEKTGAQWQQNFLEQLATYGDLDRDPQKRTITVAYWAIVSNLSALNKDEKFGNTELVDVLEVEDSLVKLAFDHKQLLGDAINRARTKLEYSTTATKFCQEEFSLSELRDVYNIVWNTELDPGNFQRKILQTEGYVTPLEKKRIPDDRGGRPALLFKAGPSKVIFPPLTRH